MTRSTWCSFAGRFAIACLIVAVISTAGVMAGNVVAKRAFDASKKVAVPSLEPR